MLDNMRQAVRQAAAGDYVVVGYNIFAYEDAAAVLRAAEKGGFPVLLMVNKLAVSHMPVSHWANLLLPLAREAAVPVGVHLDHCYQMETVMEAIQSGFSSVMYDGSQLPLEENIVNTRAIVAQARKYNVCVEGEVGSVPYSDMNDEIKNELTRPEDAARFAAESGVDWMAVSVGNVHRLQQKTAHIDVPLLSRLEACTDIPLVIHGATGIPDAELRELVGHRVGKINVGTTLRLAYVGSLRRELTEHPDEYDILKIVQKPMESVEREVLHYSARVNLCPWTHSVV